MCRELLRQVRAWRVADGTNVLIMHGDSGAQLTFTLSGDGRRERSPGAGGKHPTHHSRWAYEAVESPSGPGLRRLLVLICGC